MEFFARTKLSENYSTFMNRLAPANRCVFRSILSRIQKTSEQIVPEESWQSTFEQINHVGGGCAYSRLSGEKGKEIKRIEFADAFHC